MKTNHPKIYSILISLLMLSTIFSATALAQDPKTEYGEGGVILQLGQEDESIWKFLPFDISRTDYHETIYLQGEGELNVLYTFDANREDTDFWGQQTGGLYGENGQPIDVYSGLVVFKQDMANSDVTARNRLLFDNHEGWRGEYLAKNMYGPYCEGAGVDKGWYTAYAVVAPVAIAAVVGYTGTMALSHGAAVKAVGGKKVVSKGGTWVAVKVGGKTALYNLRTTATYLGKQVMKTKAGHAVAGYLAYLYDARNGCLSYEGKYHEDVRQYAYEFLQSDSFRIEPDQVGRYQHDMPVLDSDNTWRCNEADGCHMINVDLNTLPAGDYKAMASYCAVQEPSGAASIIAYPTMSMCQSTLFNVVVRPADYCGGGSPPEGMPSWDDHCYFYGKSLPGSNHYPFVCDTEYQKCVDPCIGCRTNLENSACAADYITSAKQLKELRSKHPNLCIQGACIEAEDCEQYPKYAQYFKKQEINSYSTAQKTNIIENLGAEFGQGAHCEKTNPANQLVSDLNDITRLEGVIGSCAPGAETREDCTATMGAANDVAWTRMDGSIVFGDGWGVDGDGNCVISQCSNHCTVKQDSSYVAVRCRAQDARYDTEKDCYGSSPNCVGVCDGDIPIREGEVCSTSADCTDNCEEGHLAYCIRRADSTKVCTGCTDDPSSDVSTTFCTSDAWCMWEFGGGLQKCHTLTCDAGTCTDQISTCTIDEDCIAQGGDEKPAFTYFQCVDGCCQKTGEIPDPQTTEEPVIIKKKQADNTILYLALVGVLMLFSGAYYYSKKNQPPKGKIPRKAPPKPTYEVQRYEP